MQGLVSYFLAGCYALAPSFLLNMTLHPPQLDTARVSRALSHRVIGSRIVHYRIVDSTMDEARELAEAGAAEGAIVVAEEQSAGRGRFDRAWVSPRSQNLHLTALLRPTTAQLPFVNMAATLATAHAASRFCDAQAKVKWPNDVRVGGRKIAGILIETATSGQSLGYALVGIGLNVNFDPSDHPEIADLATSIRRETGLPADRSSVLETLLARFDNLYAEVRRGESLTHRWAATLETLGRQVRLSWQGNTVEGRAESVDERGNLVLRLADGSAFTAVAGEVTSQT